jgi:hypothetical protein
MGLEGALSKRFSAPYRSGPSRDWLKVKNPDSPAMIRAHVNTNGDPCRATQRLAPWKRSEMPKAPPSWVWNVIVVRSSRTDHLFPMTRDYRPRKGDFVALTIDGESLCAEVQYHLPGDLTIPSLGPRMACSEVRYGRGRLKERQ